MNSATWSAEYSELNTMASRASSCSSSTTGSAQSSSTHALSLGARKETMILRTASVRQEASASTVAR
ncbi:hypothetical protein [Streptomyces sp. NPDC014734]|uniref:hypothetical protein n=1 Tax=Streptomyces sp. NPDC014734 TaxID=3364886 RepID=UPI0036FE49FB